MTSDVQYCHNIVWSILRQHDVAVLDMYSMIVDILAVFVEGKTKMICCYFVMIRQSTKIFFSNYKCIR